jgi:hypothetical protein
LIFFDLKKAYDSISRKLLQQGLEKANVNQSIIYTTKNTYHNNKCRIKIRPNLSEKYCNNTGLLQGCPLSSTLFKVYIDKVLKEWSKKCKLMGLKIGKDCYIHNLLFAYDQVVNTQGAEDANYMSRKTEDKYEKWGLKINNKKQNT